MKKLLIPALLAALIVGCSSTPIDETAGAPVESRSGSGVTPVTAGGLDSRGLAVMAAAVRETPAAYARGAFEVLFPDGGVW